MSEAKGRFIDVRNLQSVRFIYATPNKANQIWRPGCVFNRRGNFCQHRRVHCTGTMTVRSSDVCARAHIVHLSRPTVGSLNASGLAVDRQTGRAPSLCLDAANERARRVAPQPAKQLGQTEAHTALPTQGRRRDEADARSPHPVAQAACGVQDAIPGA
jgi:hypothetical protein